MTIFGRAVPADIQAIGGPKYLVGVVSTAEGASGDMIEFGPMTGNTVNAVGIKVDSAILGAWAIGAFSRKDAQDIIDGLTQILADNPEIT